ncbi:hypothetical protein [Pedobacter panaciterrae]
MHQPIDMRAGIFIDNSGNPGTKTENRYDSTDRKSWYALLLFAKNGKELPVFFIPFQ